MSRITARPVIYSALSIIGIVFVIYSIIAKNYFLAVISILFAGTSAYNIFCGMTSKGQAGK